MATTSSSDHSAIYRNLYLHLVIANDISLAIRSAMVNWKVSLMQLRPQFNSYNLMLKVRIIIKIKDKPKLKRGG
jgi:hypothetical protein